MIQLTLHRLTIIKRHGSVDPEEARDEIAALVKELNDLFEMEFCGITYKERPKGIVSIEIHNIYKQAITIWLKP